jgi:hypothetical protein
MGLSNPPAFTGALTPGDLLKIDPTGTFASDAGVPATAVPKPFAVAIPSNGIFTVDWSLGNICVATCSSNTSLTPTFTNLPTNQFVTLVIGTVGFNLRGINWPSIMRFNVADNVKTGTEVGLTNGTSINAYKYTTTYFSDGTNLWATPNSGYIQTVISAHVNGTSIECYDQANIGSPGTLQFLFGGELKLQQTTRVTSDGDVGFRRNSAGVWQADSGAVNGTPGLSTTLLRDWLIRHVIAGGAPPTIASGFGTSPTIAGADESLRVTIGTGGLATSGVVTFGTAYGSRPVCVAVNETSGAAVKCVPTTTNVTLSQTLAFGAGDVVSMLTRGY